MIITRSQDSRSVYNHNIQYAKSTVFPHIGNKEAELEVKNTLPFTLYAKNEILRTRFSEENYTTVERNSRTTK